MAEIEKIIEFLEDDKNYLFKVAENPNYTDADRRKADDLYLDIKEAIQTIRELNDGERIVNGVVDYCDMNQQCRYVKELQEQIPKWHRVADGDLPNEYEKYYLCLLSGAHNYGGNIQACKYRKADKFIEHDYFDHMRDGFPKVIAWMELPKFEEE